MESAYQICFEYELRQSGTYVESEKGPAVNYKGITVDCGYRVDMLIEHDKIIIENKAVKELNEIHLSQIMTYMKLSKISLGFLINWNVRHLKDGIKRVVL